MNTNNNRYGKILLEDELDHDNRHEIMKINELTLEQKKELVVDQISDIYDSVFVDYLHGKKMVYNPFLFFRITKDQFINWVIDHNMKLYKLFHTNAVIN